MMPTLAIMAMAVARAATITEVREREAASPRPASIPSAPKNRRMALRVRLVTSNATAGAVSAAQPTASNADAYPHSGLPSTGPAAEASSAATASSAAATRRRPQCKRAWRSCAPRPIAETGATAMASRAGANADSRATAAPATTPAITALRVNSTWAGRLLV